MNPLLTLGAILALLVVMTILAGALFFGPRRHRLALSNVAEGTHAHGGITLTADNAFGSLYLLAKRGTDADHMDICGAGDLPLGSVEDEPDAGEIAAVRLFGGQPGTALVVASGAIDADVDLYTAASGKVQTEPGVAGTYYLIGRSVKAAAADGDVFEILPCKPVLLTVVALARNDTTAHAVTDFQAALATPGLVKMLGA